MTKVDVNGFPIPEPPELREIRGVWDCIDPCAFLCYCVQTSALPLDGKVRETLDAFGWLNEDGYPDYDHMRREFARDARLNQ